MPGLVLLAPEPGAGKTTLAVAIHQEARGAGEGVTAIRLGDDASAASDAGLFSRLSEAGNVAIEEAPAGDAGAGTQSRALVVSGPATSAPDLAAFCRAVGQRLAGVILNRVPLKQAERRRQAVESAGLSVALVVPEDRVLATPGLGDVAASLDAEMLFFDSNTYRPLDTLVIAPVSADPGEGYFNHHQANSVVVRSDKPDLQLAALNAGATCLIVTGGLPLLGYVTERAEADEIPIIRTLKDTLETIRSVEELYGSGPFTVSPEKLNRLEELTRGFDVRPLLSA
jgi:hypothetical protein